MLAKKQAPPKAEPPTLGFATVAEFEAWVAEHREDQAGLWLRLAKKGSGIESVTYAEAVQVALCYGWIDGQARGSDGETWQQRFCPRRPRSGWSYPSQTHGRLRPAARLPAQRRLRRRAHRCWADAARDIAEVDRAKADGRWARAYAGPATAKVPADLRAALDFVPTAAAAFDTLTSSNRYTIIRQVEDAKREETRARRIAKFVAELGLQRLSR